MDPFKSIKHIYLRAQEFQISMVSEIYYCEFQQFFLLPNLTRSQQPELLILPHLISFS